MDIRLRFATLALVLGASTAAVFADTRIEYKVTEGGGTFASTILIGQGKIRSDADKDTGAIIDPADGSMTVLDHAKKTFTRIGKAELAQMADMMKQMEQAMAQMPPEMRQMMAGRMGGVGPEAVTVDTGEKATVAGKSCRIFRTTVSGRLTSEACKADPSAIEISAADRATLTAAMVWTKELTEAMKGPMSRIADANPFSGGLVPLRTTTIMPDGSRHTSEFVSATAGALSADLFTVPVGYKEQKLAMTGRGRGGF